MIDWILSWFSKPEPMRIGQYFDPRRLTPEQRWMLDPANAHIWDEQKERERLIALQFPGNQKHPN